MTSKKNVPPTTGDEGSDLDPTPITATALMHHEALDRQLEPVAKAFAVCALLLGGSVATAIHFARANEEDLQERIHRNPEMLARLAREGYVLRELADHLNPDSRFQEH